MAGAEIGPESISISVLCGGGGGGGVGLDMEGAWTERRFCEVGGRENGAGGFGGGSP